MSEWIVPAILFALAGFAIRRAYQIGKIAGWLEALDHRNTLELAEYQPEANPACWCLTCDPVTVRMALCPDCGNKRCPKANDHRHACTGSNEPGQKGSAWEHVKP